MSRQRRFRFVQELAKGSFGTVYLAEQISAGRFSRTVAAKLLRARWSDHDEVGMRTRDEARLLGLIHHQNIVRVEDLTSIDGQCAIIMEYLEGVDLQRLAEHLRARGQSFPRAALFELASAVACALDAAYNARPLLAGEPLRVVHRDIKPSNIMVTTTGVPKVLDFGTARANFAAREARTQALWFGSHAYMAPERVRGEGDGPAADVFSLGITLCHLLTLEPLGRLPLRRDQLAERVDARLAAASLDGPLEWTVRVRSTIRAMCAYNPNERPTAAALEGVFEGLARGARDAPLRVFCRAMVPSVRAEAPTPAAGDPLLGRVIAEDGTTAFGRVASPSAEVAEVAHAPTADPAPSDLVVSVSSSETAADVTPVTRHAPPASVASTKRVNRAPFVIVGVVGAVGAAWGVVIVGCLALTVALLGIATTMELATATSDVPVSGGEAPEVTPAEPVAPAEPTRRRRSRPDPLRSLGDAPLHAWIFATGG